MNHSMRGAGRLASSFRWAADTLQPGEQHIPLVLTKTQHIFVDWNAERLGISRDESLRRYQRSWSALPGGHAGNTFRAWDVHLCEISSVLADDSPNEVFAAYEMNAPFTLLRLLSYREPICDAADPVYRTLASRDGVEILDFGCGLAQNSRALALALQSSGIRVRLALADIGSVITDFLAYLCKRQSIEAHFLECSRQKPIPDLLPCDVAFAQEFFEHVYDPVAYLDAIDRSLRPAGFLITNVTDHQKEIFHVHPHLGDVRTRLAELGYAAISNNLVFTKPA